MIKKREREGKKREERKKAKVKRGGKRLKSYLSFFSPFYISFFSYFIFF